MVALARLGGAQRRVDIPAVQRADPEIQDLQDSAASSVGVAQADATRTVLVGPCWLQAGQVTEVPHRIGRIPRAILPSVPDVFCSIALVGTDDRVFRVNTTANCTVCFVVWP